MRNYKCKFCSQQSSLIWDEMCKNCQSIYDKGFAAGLRHAYKSSASDLEFVIKKLRSKIAEI